MSTLGIENLSRVVDVDRSSQSATQMERGSPEASGKTFAGIFEQSLNQVNQDQKEADVAIKELVAGRAKNIHEAMLAVEKADTSLKMMMQVRNKILDAYREVMRMQV